MIRNLSMQIGDVALGSIELCVIANIANVLEMMLWLLMFGRLTFYPITTPEGHFEALK